MLVNTGASWLADAFASLRCKVGLAVCFRVIEGMIEGVGVRAKTQLRRPEVLVMWRSKQRSAVS